MVRHLPTSTRATFRRKLWAAYGHPTYAEAKTGLQKNREEPMLLNQSAAVSLDESLEEKLTLPHQDDSISLGEGSQAVWAGRAKEG